MVAPRAFIDESGNTGRDIYELQQPLLTYAGVWLDAAQEAAASREVDHLVKAHRLQRKGELKGKSILNSRGGRLVVRDLLRWLRQDEIAVTAIAVEKAFMAASVLVEDCTDLVHNDAYDARWTWDTRLKEPLAERIARSAPRDLLEEAWRQRNGCDKEAFFKAYRTLIFALTLSADDVVAREARRMQRTDLDDIWTTTSDTRGSNGGYSPNLAAFTSLIMNGEIHAEFCDYSDVELVHDEQQQYRQVFEQAWSIIRGNGIDQAKVTLPNQSEVVFGLKRLTRFRFDNSATNIGIQIADFVASAMRVALIEESTRIVERSRDYLADLQALLAVQPAVKNSPFVIGSETWQLAAMKLLLGRDPRHRG